MDPTQATPGRTASTPRTSTAPDLEALVRELDDLDGPSLSLLISTGEPAVRPLTRVLLGPPRRDPLPRVVAAEVLGAIGGPLATQALIGALCRGPLRVDDPALRSSEEVVRSAVARELARLGNRSAAGPLLYALRRFRLVDAGRALLRFGDARAIPYLVECLENEPTREAAAAVLLEFGAAAVAALTAGLTRREDQDGAETPGSKARRNACARLLAVIGARQPTPRPLECA